MDIIIEILGAIVVASLFAFLGYKIYYKPTIIEHKLNPASWFCAHLAIYFLTIFLMVGSDVIVINWKVDKCMPLSIKGVLYLFVQNGGLIIFVMAISFLFYDMWIKLIEFNYFIERYKWLKKLFFTVVCVSLIMMYLIIMREQPKNKNILCGEHQYWVVWLIAFIEIWIGFDTSFFSRDKLSEWIALEKEKIKREEEKKYIISCMATMIIMLIVPLILWISLKLSADILSFANNIIAVISVMFMIGATVMIFTVLFLYYKERPNQKKSRKKYQALFAKVQKEKRTAFYMGLKYMLWKEEDEYFYKIEKKNIMLGDEKNFSNEYIKEFQKAFDQESDKYSLKKYNEKEIYRLIEEKIFAKAKKRQELLREGWKIVYEICEKNEKEYTDLMNK